MLRAEPNRGLLTSVLVLNRFYMAVHVVGVRRAFGLLYREVAEVISVEEGQYANYDFESWLLLCEMRGPQRQRHEDWIRSVRCDIQVPRVIRLTRYDRVPKRSLRFNRRNLLARDEHQCQYCGVSLPPSQLSLDHVLPRSRGGQTSWENVVCSCIDCNTRKGGRTPQEARMRLRQRPARPRRDPILVRKLDNPKYESWRTFLTTSLGSADTG
jgi:5-methylcytosine-specific restriction endonuclease McrA